MLTQLEAAAKYAGCDPKLFLTALTHLAAAKALEKSDGITWTIVLQDCGATAAEWHRNQVAPAEEPETPAEEPQPEPKSISEFVMSKIRSIGGRNAA